MVSVKKDYARAIIKEILAPGQRIDPPCPWFGRCGGCDFQHLDYQLQLAIKAETVKNTLRRIGGVEPGIVKAIIPTRPWHYRNKLQMPVAMVQGKLAAGFYENRSHNLVPVDECIIQHEANNEVARRIAIIARENAIPPWAEDKLEGVLRHVVVRHAVATGEILAAIVVSSRKFANRERFLADLKEGLPGLTSLVLNENPRPTNVVLGDREEVIWGPGYITEVIDGLKFKVSPGSFWQVNPVGAEKILEQVRDYAQLTGKETVVDVYCGTGSIGLSLAQWAGEIIGVESNGKAVADAKVNARLNRIANAHFYRGNAEATLPEMVGGGLKAEVIILDPPRKGCQESLLKAVAEVGPARVVYVSCNPGTLARDLKSMVEKGYNVQQIQPIDMFPQTSHVECVVLMSKANT